MESNISNKGRLTTLFMHYFGAVLLFMLEKPLFMVFAGGLRHHYSIREWVLVIWHGIPIDLSVAGYLTLFPLLVILTGIWIQSLPVKRIIQVYDGLMALLLSSIFVGDAALYPFWGFKLDASVLFYLKTPKEAVASVSPWMVVIGIAAILLVTWIIYKVLSSAVRPAGIPYNKVLMRVPVTLMHIALFAPLLLAIRGGVSESTMNVGHAYFTSDQFLNHSAVNPGFSLLSSISKTSDYSEWYDYLDEERRSEVFQGLYDTSESINDTLLNTTRPNVMILVMEGMGGDFVNAISGMKDVTPNLDSLIKESVFFSNCYAGSFRTDRGLVCVMNGHPSPRPPS